MTDFPGRCSTDSPASKVRCNPGDGCFPTPAGARASVHDAPRPLALRSPPSRGFGALRCRGGAPRVLLSDARRAGHHAAGVCARFSIERYLRCGRLEHGFVRVKCTGCAVANSVTSIPFQHRHSPPATRRDSNAVVVAGATDWWPRRHSPTFLCRAAGGGATSSARAPFARRHRELATQDPVMSSRVPGVVVHDRRSLSRRAP